MSFNGAMKVHRSTKAAAPMHRVPVGSQTAVNTGVEPEVASAARLHTGGTAKGGRSLPILGLKTLLGDYASIPWQPENCQPIKTPAQP